MFPLPTEFHFHLICFRVIIIIIIVIVVVMTDKQNVTAYKFPPYVLVKSTIYEYFHYLQSLEIYAVSSA
jgi:hypothetical protein